MAFQMSLSALSAANPLADERSGREPDLRFKRDLVIYLNQNPIEGWHGGGFSGAELASTRKVSTMTGPRSIGISWNRDLSYKLWVYSRITLWLQELK